MTLFAALFAESCHGYLTVAVDRRYSLNRSDGSGGVKRAARFRVPANRTIARIWAPSPVALINNRAVDLALTGRYGEAEILFRETIAESVRDGAPFNNLGVMCELGGNRDEAFRMYLEACRLEPDNAVFRENFSDFVDYRE